MTERSADMNQTATYWQPTVSDKFGNKGFMEPVQIMVRWQNSTKLFRDSQGREMVSQAIVYPEMELQIGGYLYLGNVEYDTPQDTPFAYEIRQVERTADISGTEFLNKVWL